MQTQHHQAGEQPLAPPLGHGNAEQAGKQTIGGTGDGVGVKQILPHHSQRPLGHNVGENKDGAEVFPPCQIGSGNQKGENAAKQNGDDAGSYGQVDGIQQRNPQVLFCHSAGKEVDVIDQGEAAGFAGEVGIDGARMDGEGIFDDGDDGGDGGDGDHDAQHQ